MPSTRTKAIIAVFGGNDPKAVAFAKRLGAAIADQKKILLTGGREPGTKHVKDSAISGVGLSPRIGVDRPKVPPKTVTYLENGPSFVIVSDLDHKRNYLEATICDAAIGLTGEKGTYSEVVFALSLHRPVALVGTCWEKRWPINKQRTPNSATDEAMSKVGEVAPDRPLLRNLLNGPTVLHGLETLPPNCYRYFGSEDAVNEEEVVKWVLMHAHTIELPGSLALIERYEDVRGPYEKWLAKYAA